MELQELIQSIDIVEFIGQYIDLEEKNGEFWGLSCFNDERTPSFSIRRDPPFFYDFSSGKSGNVWVFVKEYFHCSNKQAVEILKEYAGCTDDVDVRCEKLSATIDCQRFKVAKAHEKEYKQTIMPENYMTRFEKDYDKLAVWESEGISKETLDDFQVYYDPFSNRIVYPIRNLNGDIVNIGGRTLDPMYKEKRLRKYTYFQSWGTMNVLYGLYENMDYVKSKKEIIIFEGCKSVLIASTWGIRNTCAILTSHLNPNQMRILARLGYRVVFALDKDVKIIDDKNIRSLSHYVDVEFLWDKQNLTDDKDAPVDKGKEVFLSLYDWRCKYRC